MDLQIEIANRIYKEYKSKHLKCDDMLNIVLIVESFLSRNNVHLVGDLNAEEKRIESELMEKKHQLEILDKELVLMKHITDRDSLNRMLAKRAERKNCYCVYQLTSPSGKIYIGCSNDPICRWNKGNGYVGNEILYDEILNYGWENFKKQILHDGLNKKDASFLENKEIKERDATNPDIGFNRRLEDYEV